MKGSKLILPNHTGSHRLRRCHAYLVVWNIQNTIFGAKNENPCLFGFSCTRSSWAWYAKSNKHKHFLHTLAGLSLIWMERQFFRSPSWSWLLPLGLELGQGKLVLGCQQSWFPCTPSCVIVVVQPEQKASCQRLHVFVKMRVILSVLEIAFLLRKDVHTCICMWSCTPYVHTCRHMNVIALSTHSFITYTAS